MTCDSFRADVWILVTLVILQLGPNPCFLDGEMLVRGQSGKLCQGGTLFLVNRSHPFKLHYNSSSNGSTPSGARGGGGLKASDKTKGARNGKGKETPTSIGPKRSIKDFFGSSPVKVRYWVMFGPISTISIQFKEEIGPRAMNHCKVFENCVLRSIMFVWFCVCVLE